MNLPQGYSEEEKGRFATRVLVLQYIPKKCMRYIKRGFPNILATLKSREGFDSKFVRDVNMVVYVS